MKKIEDYNNNELEIIRAKVSGIVAGAMKTQNGKKIATVPIDLIILPDYQRDITKSMNAVTKIMKEWNNEKCDLLTLYYRDGLLYCNDGQHRCSAAELCAMAPKSLDAEIRENATYAEEAMNFANQNKNVTTVKGYDKFIVRNKANDYSDKDAVVDMSIARVCDKHNIEVSRNKKIGTLSSLCAPRSIVRAYGEDAFNWVMTILCESALGYNKDGFCSNIVEALGDVYKKTQSKDLADISSMLISHFTGKTMYDIDKERGEIYKNIEKRAALKAMLHKVIRKYKKNLKEI